MPVPTWLQGQSTFEFVNITSLSSSNRLSDIVPSPATYPGSDDATSLLEAWNDRFIRKVGDKIWYGVHGGGHSDGADNAIYLYGDINSDNPTWTRVAGSFSDPADIPAGGNVSHNNDGRPAANHGYNMLAYDPVGDRLVRMACADAYGGLANTYKTVDIFSFASGTWSTGTDSPGTRSPQRGGAVWDSLNSRVLYWYGGGGFPYDRLRSYVIDTDTHDIEASNNTASELEAGSSLAYDPSRDILLVLDRIGDEFRLWDDIGNTSHVPKTITLTGNTEPLIITGAGLTYDPDRDRFIFYRGITASETVVYEIDPTPYDTGGNLNWPCTKVTPSGGATPSNPGGAGEEINGGFEFISAPNFSGYIVTRAFDGDVYFYATSITEDLTAEPKLSKRKTKKAITTSATKTTAIDYIGGDVTNIDYDAVYIGGAGSLVVVTKEGDPITFDNLQAGTILPVAIIQVTQSGSSATGLLGLNW